MIGACFSSRRFPELLVHPCCIWIPYHIHSRGAGFIAMVLAFSFQLCYYVTVITELRSILNLS